MSREGNRSSGIEHEKEKNPLLLSLIKLSFLSLMVGLVLYDQGVGNPVYPESERSQGRLTILYDNNPYDYRLKSSWGFSCLIEF
jgi:hypothetical protein